MGKAPFQKSQLIGTTLPNPWNSYRRYDATRDITRERITISTRCRETSREDTQRERNSVASYLIANNRCACYGSCRPRRGPCIKPRKTCGGVLAGYSEVTRLGSADLAGPGQSNSRLIQPSISHFRRHPKSLASLQRGNCKPQVRCLTLCIILDFFLREICQTSCLSKQDILHARYMPLPTTRLRHIFHRFCPLTLHFLLKIPGIWGYCGYPYIARALIRCGGTKKAL